MQILFVHNIFDVWFLLLLVKESDSAPIYVRFTQMAE